MTRPLRRAAELAGAALGCSLGAAFFLATEVYYAVSDRLDARSRARHPVRPAGDPPPREDALWGDYP